MTSTTATPMPANTPASAEEEEEDGDGGEREGEEEGEEEGGVFTEYSTKGGSSTDAPCNNQTYISEKLGSCTACSRIENAPATDWCLQQPLRDAAHS